jgi:glycosyltransferase involved in cell wall biosynthesis
MSEDKGIALFLKACQIVARKRPDVKVVVLGASSGSGRGGVDYLVEMKSLARALGIDANIEFLGFRRDARELMRQIEVFVMASQRSRGSSSG